MAIERPSPEWSESIGIVIHSPSCYSLHLCLINANQTARLRLVGRNRAAFFLPWLSFIIVQQLKVRSVQILVWKSGGCKMACLVLLLKESLKLQECINFPCWKPRGLQKWCSTNQSINKILWKKFFTLFLLLGVLSAWAYVVEVDGIYYYLDTYKR